MPDDNLEALKSEELLEFVQQFSNYVSLCFSAVTVHCLQPLLLAQLVQGTASRTQLKRMPHVTRRTHSTLQTGSRACLAKKF